MVATRKVGKKPIGKMISSKKVKLVTPKKSVKSAVKRAGRVSSATVSKKSAASRSTPKTRVIKHQSPAPWGITLVFGTPTGTFGLANDQRIYRWNTRSALWVLHKEGLTA